MNPKIKKVTKDIEKTRSKIAELQARLQDMETQKTELENIEYVSIIRSLNISPDQLADFVKGYKAEPATETASPVVDIAASEESDAYDNVVSEADQEATYNDMDSEKWQDEAYSGAAYTAESDDSFSNTINAPYEDEQEDSYYEG